jgi:alpha-mannosidase
MKKIHLICNAHIDPVWQWEWEEGAAAAVSTFRAAADFCEEFEGFLFNHNEVILYKWIEEYEPALFQKIQKLVSEGKWHIIGGWYLQPDCNMPSGESFVRQILLGKTYFMEKFGVEPTTAVNFDAFGHTRGLVQILKKAGYDSYLFMRPDHEAFRIPARDFVWVGLDGSEVMAHKICEGYNSLLGHADEKILNWMKSNPDTAVGLIAWGVGNHGGGPSRYDLNFIAGLMKETQEYEMLHSTPEKFFHELAQSGVQLPRVERDLNPRFPGCYTSQIRIKQKHRQLENELYLTEKMLSHAALQGYLPYPQRELNEAACDLMTAEFHDILPGSSVQPVEETSLRIMDHGLEILSRLKARAFFALSAGQEKAGEGEYPILVYNPHPYKVKGIFEGEFMLADQNWKDEFSMPVVYQQGVRIPSQAEKEHSNLNLDWRKRVTFYGELEPSQMNRFDCKIEILPHKPDPVLREENGNIVFVNDEMEVMINCTTGLIDKYSISGTDYLEKNVFEPLVLEDNEDPWRMDIDSFRHVEGAFALMSKEEGTKFSGVLTRLLESVRVIEDGTVRSVVEAVFKYCDSYLVMTYKLPKKGTEIQVQVRVNWSEKSRMLKLSIPTVFQTGRYVGQVAYGTDVLPDNGNEAVSQKWSAVVSDTAGKALSIVNDGIYGSDCKDGEIRLSLLRSPGYCAHPIMDRPIMMQDRYSPRIDQGERLYSFWLNAGETRSLLNTIDRQALVHNEKPYVLSFFPSGAGVQPKPMAVLGDAVVQLTACKKAEASEDYVIRLFEPTGQDRVTTLEIPAVGMKQEISLKGFEIKTLLLDKQNKVFLETNLIEKPI